MALPDYFKSIQILAAQAVRSGSMEYFERFVLRWFSKTFSTPYPVVKEMEFDEVLQAFWEDHYAQMDPDAFTQALRELLETPEERSARIQADELEELEMQRLARQVEELNAKKRMEEVVKPTNRPVIPKEMKEAGLPEDVPQALKDLIRPDIEIKFAGSDEFERLVESIDALGTVQKEKP